MKTVNLELPDYLWTDLRIRSADRFAIKEADMIEDGRRLRGPVNIGTMTSVQLPDCAFVVLCVGDGRQIVQGWRRAAQLFLSLRSPIVMAPSFSKTA